MTFSRKRSWITGRRTRGFFLLRAWGGFFRGWLRAVCRPECVSISVRHLCFRHDGELISEPNRGLGSGCRGDKFGQFDHVRNGAAICAARKEHHIGAQLANSFDFFHEGVASLDARMSMTIAPAPSAQTAALSPVNGLNDAADHHLQAPACVRWKCRCQSR